jgi:hypothetical protein
VVIGRAQDARNTEGDAKSFFIPARDPMPVGTVLRLRSGDQETPVRVVRAVETTDAAACGMHVRTIGEAEEVAREFIPPPAAVAVVEKLKPATPTPVVEVDPSKTRDDLPAADVAQTAVPEAMVSAAADPVSVQSEPAVEPAVLSKDYAPAAEANDSAPAATPVAPVTTTLTEVTAIPESVPITVGSSVTGALRNATESVTITTPSSEAPTVRGAPARDPASPRAAVTGPANATLAYGSVVEEASAASTPTSTEDLPPARPIAGPSTRRKTKKRK